MHAHTVAAEIAHFLDLLINWGVNYAVAVATAVGICLFGPLVWVNQASVALFSHQLLASNMKWIRAVGPRL